MARHRFVAIAVAGMFLFLGDCKERVTDEPERPIAHRISLTLNGGPFTNQTYTLETPLYPVSGAWYDDSSMITICHVYGTPYNTPYSVDLSFPGSQSGIFPWTNFLTGSYLNVFMSSSPFSPSQLLSTSSGTTTVTSYGLNGQPVAGSLAGMMILRATGDTVSASGTFSIQRIR